MLSFMKVQNQNEENIAGVVLYSERTVKAFEKLVNAINVEIKKAKA